MADKIIEPLAKIDPTVWNELRKPFPPEVVGHLTRGGAKIDFVGHAAVTDRLNTVAGPENWNWEPLAITEEGFPKLDTKGNLWIKLTICGVTRLGYGDGSTSIKELIGDALRNAAMRFGVALDLWSKEELESTLADPSMKTNRASKAPTSAATPPSGTTKPQLATAAQKVKITGHLRKQGVLDEAIPKVLSDDYGVSNPHAMTTDEAENVLAVLSTFKKDDEATA